jgi:hypothetical protein
MQCHYAVCGVIMLTAFGGICHSAIFAKCRYAECRYAETHYAESHYTESHYT